MAMPAPASTRSSASTTSTRASRARGATGSSNRDGVRAGGAVGVLASASPIGRPQIPQNLDPSRISPAH